MRNNYFENYDEYQRNRLKHLTLKLVEKEKNTFIDNQDRAVYISNIFLKEIVKPCWFRDDIETIRDLHEYISDILNNWKSFSKIIPRIKCQVLYPEDIINDKQKEYIRTLIEQVKNIEFTQYDLPLKYRKLYSGQPIENMDINSISKVSYKVIVNFLNTIKLIGERKDREKAI